jgi:hypothetical protein
MRQQPQRSELAPFGVMPGLMSATSFLRLVDLPFEGATAAVQELWDEDAREGLVEDDSLAFVGVPEISSGVTRAALVLKRPVGRSLLMELELSPWSDGGEMTRVELVARRQVRTTDRYFQTANRALNVVLDELERRAHEPSQA